VDRSILAARIQDILKGRSKPSRPESAPGDAPPRPCDEGAAFAARCAADEAASTARDLLGGEVLDGPGGRCLVVDRRYDAAHVHGRRAVGGYASAAAAAMHVLPSFLAAGGAPRDAAAEPADGQGRLEPAQVPRLLFFDLETTGLSGGAGTYAFLVGCGFFEGEEFSTRQFFLRGFGEERALLDAVRGFVEDEQGEDQPCLVTYNGRSFDLPLIETRYLFHRRTSPFASLPHVDMLFSARRLWKRRTSVLDHLSTCVPGDLRASCALTALEQDILGLRREDDVPGWEIPARYFTYTRTGDARGLTAVLEHNRLDLLSLAALTSVILEMVVEHEQAAGGREQSLSLARLLDYLGRTRDAERCYERAAAPDGLVEGEFDRSARIEALHWLALYRRRARRFADAADAWRGLLQVPSLDPELRREACEALAIHHEHRVKDLDAARSFALRALDVARGGRHVPEVEHRLGRLQRKLTGRTTPDPATRAPLQPSLPGES
jgi:uncharacterized protein YprB with RNaseH-like and TPR domain